MERTTTNSQGVKTVVTSGPISLDKIDKSNFQKPGTLTAQIRQDVITVSYYPSKKISNEMQANVFSNEDFGFEPQVFESKETRVAWFPVPEKITVEEVKIKLAAAVANGACIYRVLSHEPILSKDQTYAIEQGIKTKDDFANSQVVRYPENTETLEKGIANTLTLKGGLPQYRRTFLWLTPMDDQDARDTTKVYMSAEIEAELAGASVMQGQAL